MNKTKVNADEIRRNITDSIVASIDKGCMPWRQPWKNNINAGLPCNFASGRRYSGINILILMIASEMFGYRSKHWGSANSVVKKLGVHIKKGEKATFVTFFKMLPLKNKETGNLELTVDGKQKFIPLLRTYPVFNLEQFQAPEPKVLLDGKGKFSLVKSMLGQDASVIRKNVTTVEELYKIAENFLPARLRPAQGMKREELAEWISAKIGENLKSYLVDDTPETTLEIEYEPAETLIKNSGATIKHGGNMAYYSPSMDLIGLPLKTAFDSLPAYYSVAFHELAHWTKKEGRSPRQTTFDDKDDAYAFEELIAEMTACFVMTELRVPLASELLEQSKAYLNIWLKRMENDSKYIFNASREATKATDCLLSFIGRQNVEWEDESEEGENK